MLTFESMMSIDPAMGGFAPGAGTSGVGATASGNPSAASGQFAAQLSGVMSNDGQAIGSAGLPGEAVYGADGSMGAGNGADAGFGITLQLSDEAAALATPEAAFVQAVLQSGDVPVDLAGAETVVDGDGAGEGEGPAEGETSDEALAAALASGLTVTPAATAPAEPAPVDGEVVVATVAGDEGEGVDPLASGKAGAADVDGELELPTFFPSANRAARGATAGGAAAGESDDVLVKGEAGAPGPAKAEARAALAALSADDVAAAVNGATDGEADTETEAALRALLTGSKGDAARQSSNAASSRDTTGGPAVGDGAKAAATVGGDDLAARAPKRLVGGLTGANVADGADDAVDEALISVKATRSNESAATPTAANAGAVGARADDEALRATAAKAAQRIASGQAGEGDSEVAADDAADSDPANEAARVRLKAAMPRADEQATAKPAPGKVATAGERLAGEGDLRSTNLSSATDMSEDGEVSLKTAEKTGPVRANGSAEARKPADVLVSTTAMAGVVTQANVDGDEAKSLDPLTLGTSIDPAATSSRSMDAQAARLAQTAQGTASSLPTAMVAAEIARNAQRGVSRFEIRLDPPELGRVDVHLKINEDGKVQAHLVVERRDTLDMFMRDQRGMERALENAGLKTNADGGLQFSLKDQGQNFAGRDGNQNGNGTQASGLNKEAAVGEAAETTLMPERISAYSRNGANGVDIRI